MWGDMSIEPHSAVACDDTTKQLDDPQSQNRRPKTVRGFSVLQCIFKLPPLLASSVMAHFQDKEELVLFTLQCCAVVSTAQFSVVQYSTVQYSTVHYSGGHCTVQCSIGSRDWLSDEDLKKNPHTGNTRTSHMCVIQEYRFYTMSLKSIPWVLSIPLVLVYTMHESLSLP